MKGELKLINEKTDKGLWVTREQLIKLINICKYRHNELYNKFYDGYEHLFNEKFPKKERNKDDKF